MQYITSYRSPLGGILLAADEEGLTGLWFEGQKYFALRLDPDHREQETSILEQAKRWLDVYFSGREPDFSVPLHMIGTGFQKEVWELLCEIPYGQTCTYGEIAGKLAAQRGLPHLSAQAVGGAVGHNEISILIPCHRVVGKSGSLTGYAGGLEKKVALLRLEQVDTSAFLLPAPSRGRREPAVPPADLRPGVEAGVGVALPVPTRKLEKPMTKISMKKIC